MRGVTSGPGRLRVAVGSATVVWAPARLRGYAEHWGAGVAASWLPEAARHAELLCGRWGLVPVAPAGDGVQSLVLYATTSAGASVVLKVPRSPAAGAREHEALVRWASAPVPGVAAFDSATGALLLQQLEPAPIGYTAGDVMTLARRLHVPPPLGTEPMETTCRLLLGAAQGHHVGRDGAAAQHRADLTVAKELMSAMAGVGDRVLLHGDLLHKNLLPTSAGLYAIDPQPVAGPAELELARWVAWGGSDHATDFDQLVGELLAVAPGEGDVLLDADRLVHWTWAVSVCENKPGRAGERPRVAFIDRHRPS